jgi:hypothetical protein
LKLADISKAEFSDQSNKINITLKDSDKRGAMMVEFRRERTRNRFLKFVKKWGISVVETEE